LNKPSLIHHLKKEDDEKDSDEKETTTIKEHSEGDEKEMNQDLQKKMHCFCLLLSQRNDFLYCPAEPPQGPQVRHYPKQRRSSSKYFYFFDVQLLTSFFLLFLCFCCCFSCCIRIL